MSERPEAPDAERAVLGSILLDRDAIATIADSLPAEAFTSAPMRAIYDAALALYRRRVPPDVLTIRDAMEQRGTLESAGGMSALIDLSDSVPTAYHVEYYAQIVRARYEQRRAMDLGAAIVRLAAQTADPEALHAGIGQAVRAFSSAMPDNDGIHHIGVALDSILRRLDDGAEPGIPTGFCDLDRMIGGLFPGALDVVGARPGMGKSALAGQIAAHVADGGRPVLVFSLEMTEDELAERQIATRSGVDSSAIHRNRLDTPSLQRVVDTMPQIDALPIYICDRGALTIELLAAKARRFAMQQPALGLIVVDYLQLLQGSRRYDGNRVQEVSEISRGLKELAKELRVPVLALSQLSRALEARPNKIPTMADLRESGAIEQDADLIAFLYRDEVYHADTDKQGIAELHIAKNRHGPMGVVLLRWDAEHVRFGNLELRRAA